MENASKALLLAAEVMVGVLVLSLMVYLFVTFGASSAQINEKLDSNKLSEFNNQFDKYIGTSDITIYDIVTLANLARENNEYYELDSSTEGNYYISIKLDGLSLEKKKSIELTEIIEDKLKNNNSFNRYICNSNNVIYSSVTGRVREVNFSTHTE